MVVVVASTKFEKKSHEMNQGEELLMVLGRVIKCAYQQTRFKVIGVEASVLTRYLEHHDSKAHWIEESEINEQIHK